MKDRKICVGMIAGAYGVRGLVRLCSFTEDPSAIASYGPLFDEDGAKLKLTIKSAAKDYFVASVDGVTVKEAADKMRGTKLFVPRDALPKTTKSEYYEADLVGLAVKDESGKNLGTVFAVHNYGGGPFLEIGTNKKDSFMLPFNPACAPQVDLKAGQIVVQVPEGWLSKTEKAD